MIVPSVRLPRYGRLLPIVLMVCLLAGCQGARLMPTPNVFVQSPSNPFAEVAPPLRTNTVDVLYATDRQPLPLADGGLAYGYDRSPSLAFGSCVVGIGYDVSWDTLVEESRQRERSQQLPLHIRSITEQDRFPATPLSLVASNGRLTIDPVEQVHLIAHSRGTDVLTTALRELIIETRAAGQEPRTMFKLRNVVLAAADLDMEVFMQRLSTEQIGLAIDWTTIYVSEGDRAIGFSGCLFISARRVGQVRPEDLTDEQRLRMERVAKVSLIDARVSSGFIGHAYFYGHPAVSAVLILLLRDGFAPGGPGRPLRKRGENFWQITNDYLVAPAAQRQ